MLFMRFYNNIIKTWIPMNLSKMNVNGEKN